MCMLTAAVDKTTYTRQLEPEGSFLYYYLLIVCIFYKILKCIIFRYNIGRCNLGFNKLFNFIIVITFSKL